MKKSKKIQSKIDLTVKFAKPTPVTNLDLVFGGNVNDLLPDYDLIPDVFKTHSGKWNEIISNWFFMGLPSTTQFIPKEGIDAKDAVNHIMACLKSFAPKHEHKEAGCAYLMSLWFSDIIIDGKDMAAQKEALVKKWQEALKK